MGGAFIFIKANFSARLLLLSETWAKVSGKQDGIAAEAAEAQETMAAAAVPTKFKKKGFFGRMLGRKSSDEADAGAVGDTESGAAAESLATQQAAQSQGQSKIPTTFYEMFAFNATVMGLGDRPWMNEVLLSFDNLVGNVENSGRMAEECDVLVLRITKVADAADVVLGEFKACMLGSLRSLMPKDWSNTHEVAWSWIWENIEKMMLTTLGKPAAWEAAMTQFILSLDDTLKYEARESIYQTFFTQTPVGQDYFKQSTTYLHWIADQLLLITLDIYREPAKTVDDISALGLRHVGYQIPTDLFGPFVSACLEVLGAAAGNPETVESYRYSLGLVSRMLVRTIQEGSTIVMKAVNLNTQKSLRKAVGCAPRGDRATWMLKIQVGSHSISPLWWAMRAVNWSRLRRWFSI
jgi:hypothetical protein